MPYKETLEKTNRDLGWRGESGKRENNRHRYTMQIWMYIKYMKDCCKEKRTNLLSGSLAGGSRENRFKMQQERWENKNDKDREEGWLGGCAASNLWLFKEKQAPSVRAGAGRLVCGWRVDSNHLSWSLPATRFNECKLSLRALERIGFLRERVLLFLQWACR